jgi:hypothetical protein
VTRLIEIVEAFYTKPFAGPIARRQFVETLAARWGGPSDKEALANALTQMGRAFRTKHEAVPGYDFYFFEGYLATSSRFLTRPLLIRPENLSLQDEQYFLPHVFAVHERDARGNYQDAYETKLIGPPQWDYPILRAALDEALAAAESLEKLNAAPQQNWLRHVATALRLWASSVRSTHNFYFAQEIRNRHAKLLAGPPPVHSMLYDPADPDNLAWSQIQRDEFDNTNEFLALLQSGGLNSVSRAAQQRHADTFLLGPDLVNEVQRKAGLMRRHWRDVDLYLLPGRR